ncbi:polysaccharide deacetylase family protein [Streptacidiphilus sp. PAMC 29251]
MANKTDFLRQNTGPGGHLAGAERMYEEVLAEPGEQPARPGVSRRVLFAAAGVTLLSGCGAAQARSAVTIRATSSTTPPVPSERSTATPTATSTPSATPRPSLPVQTKPQFYVHGGAKVIALTLDDGPSEYTPQILEILREHRVTATFCMIGRQIAARASLVKEVAAAGHHITNHTWDHSDLSRLPLGAVTGQIARTTEAMADVGLVPTMFRAPFGAWSHTVFEAAAAANLRPLDWSVDPRDWSRPGTQSIVSTITRTTRTGSIILDHDGGGDRSQTVAAMRIWLPQLLAEGYRFTTP